MQLVAPPHVRAHLKVEVESQAESEIAYDDELDEDLST